MSVFGNPDVREIAKKFVLAADETWRLQNGNGPECRFFQSFADQGHYRAKGGTRQGYYAITPDGKLLASANTRDGDAIHGMLVRAWTAWEAMSDRERSKAPNWKPAHRWEASYPEGGLVLERFVRDAIGKDRRWNRDSVWITKDEMHMLASVPAAAGARYRWPRRLAERLVQFYLVDNVRGQTLPFARSEVAHAAIEFRVKQVTDAELHLEIRGETRAVAKGPWLWGKTDWDPTEDHPRTMRATLLGTATLNREAMRFTKFDFVALGTRTGRTGNDGPPQEEPAAGAGRVPLPTGAGLVPRRAHVHRVLPRRVGAKTDRTGLRRTQVDGTSSGIIAGCFGLPCSCSTFKPRSRAKTSRNASPPSRRSPRTATSRPKRC